MLDLTEDNFFDHLLDADRRRMLAEALRAEQGTHLPLHWQYGELALTVADADRLGRAVFALLEEAPGDDTLLRDLLRNPHTPEDALWEAYRRGRGIMPLGHRRGPRALLEALAEEHEYSEAITTLALYHYADEDDDAFRRFVERHRGITCCDRTCATTSVSRSGSARWWPTCWRRSDRVKLVIIFDGRVGKADGEG